MHQGFARDDLFVCVHEQFMTETAAMADIVLPATTFLEHDDIYTAGGHTFLQIGRAVLPPYAECRSNHDVICGLAKRLGARHPGFEMTAFELIEQTLRASGLPGPEAFEEGVWLDCWPGLRDRAFPRRVRPCRQEVPFPRRLAGVRRRSTRACRPFPTMSR